MKVAKLPLLLGLMLMLGPFASANSINNISITGSLFAGFAQSNGDFQISGTGVNLFQATPDGPDSIGTCNIGGLCDFSFGVGSTAAFCTYCTGFSGGNVGGALADFIDPSLFFTASAVWNGQSTINVPLTMTGTIIGYELVNCTDGIGCSLGPEVFDVHIKAKGIGTFTMNGNSIYGVNSTFTGTMTSAPEPVSLVLTGTGLAGIWLARRARRKKRGNGYEEIRFLDKQRAHDGSQR